MSKADGRKKMATEVGFHSLRHSFVSLSAKAEAEIKKLEEKTKKKSAEEKGTEKNSFLCDTVKSPHDEEFGKKQGSPESGTADQWFQRLQSECNDFSIDNRQ